MQLTVPAVGVTDGPAWASQLNVSLNIIDGHTHASGSGVPITPDGMNINASLSFNSNNLVDLKSTRYISNVSPLAGGSDLLCTYVSGADLYYNDSLGNQVRITQSGGVAGSPGSIANLTSPASASYVAVSTKFVWESDANVAADMDFGAAIMRNITASSFALTLQPPTLSSNYSITLPTVPAAQKFMTLDASGVMTAPWAVDASTLEISGGTTLQVKNLGITTGKIADGAVTRVKQAAVDQQLSTASGNPSNTTSSYTDIANQTVTITNVAGRPNIIAMQPDGSATNSYIRCTRSTADGNNVSGGFQLLRDGVRIAGWDIAFTDNASNAIINFQLPGGLTFTDVGVVGSPGAYVYKFQFNQQASGSAVAVTVQALKTIGFEL